MIAALPSVAVLVRFLATPRLIVTASAKLIAEELRSPATPPASLFVVAVPVDAPVVVEMLPAWP
jgi:hypothetical protein